MKKILLKSIILLTIVGCATSTINHTVNYGLNNVENEANVGFPICFVTAVKIKYQIATLSEEEIVKAATERVKDRLLKVGSLLQE